MCPTIRIDDEVYGWLQSQAIPFHDTPNAVLRRIAELESTETDASPEIAVRGTTPMKQGSRQSGRRSPQATGADCIARWSLPVRQARFHCDGTFYEHLHRFPAAYCDPDGHVVFETERKYRECQYLRLGQKVNVPGGISSMPSYQKENNPMP